MRFSLVLTPRCLSILPQVETIFGLPKNVLFGVAAGLVGVVGFLVVKGGNKARG